MERSIAPRAFIVALLTAFTIGAAPAAPASPWASLADPVFVRIDTRELPNPFVWSMAQDPAGFLWIGTQGGLARFDGYHFRSFLPNPRDSNALPDGYIRRMICDASGALWLGTASSGLVRFDPASETFRTWRADPAGRSGPRSAHIDALQEAPDGSLWIGGDGGLDRFDPRTGVFTPMDLPRPDRSQAWVRSILIDRRGTVWAGTWQDGGLYDRAAGAKRFTLFDLAAAPGRKQPRVYSLYEDAAGRIWAGSLRALFAIERGRRIATFRSSPQDRASIASGGQWAITEPVRGTIWAGTNSAISTIDVASGRVRRITPERDNPNAIADAQVLGFLRDRSGLIWIANQSGGLRVYNPRSIGLHVLPAARPEIALGQRGARSLASTPGRLWIGGRERLLSLQRNGVTNVTAVPDDFDVETLAGGAGGALWVGADGLCRLARDRALLDCPAGPPQVGLSVVSSVLDTAGTLYIGASTGLIEQDERSGNVTFYRQGKNGATLSNSSIEALYRDRAGRLWVGTANGLNRLDPGSHRFVRYVFDSANPDSIGPGSISSVIEDRLGRVWAGAIGGPLNVVQGTNGRVRVRHLGRADGMPDENVAGLAEDPSGRIWASTDKGLAVFDPRTLRARSLGLIDGVSDDVYWSGSTSQAADGTIFFGGQDGVTVIDPGAESPWDFNPPVVVTALEAGGASVSTWGVNRSDSPVELPAGAHSVSLEFASLDYSAPDAIRYAYKLDGFDRDWIATDPAHRIVKYTNLAPGAYTLRLRGTNRLGVWSTSELAVRLEAQPSWYESWWFRALVAVSIAAALYLSHLVRTAVLRRRQRELESIVETRTHELFEANSALQEMSLTDPLTGLRNRRFLMQHIDEEVALSARRYNDWLRDGSGDPPGDADLLFFLVDIDHFKAVNDELGHAAGDRVLAQMRERLEQVFRESDYLLRWGGEEFLAVARGSGRAEAPEIAERLRRAVADRVFALDGGGSIAKTASIGFAAFPYVPSDPQTVSWPQVVELADQALYMAKHSGRNAWFGLAASGDTDASSLVRVLATSPDEAAHNCALTVQRGPGAASPA